jgi:uncharacterized protein YbaR (Trm112 family)
MFTFECPECNTTSEHENDNQIHEFVKSSGVLVCPSCQSLYDVDEGTDNSINATKSRFDKTTYQNMAKGINNQLASTKKYSYTVPCPHCKHIYEMKGVPIKSVHLCAKCHGYFGINDVKVTFSNKQFKHDFQVSPIYSDSIFSDIDKLAELWSKSKTKSSPNTNR